MNALKEMIVKVLRRTLTEKLRNSIVHLGFHTAPSEFEKYAYMYHFAPKMQYGLREMARRGFGPRLVIDVGAFEGNWSRLARKIWPRSELIMVEANNGKREWLTTVAAELDATLMMELLGAEDGKHVKFNVMESGSSVMPERSPIGRVSEERVSRRLDSIVQTKIQPGLLKIDAQGYELEILKGATALWEIIEAVLLEVSLIEINEGAPLLHDVVAYMKARGFVAYDVLEIHRRPLDRALNQMDIVFVRESSALISDKRHST